jgi:hypothetical protein
VDREEDNPVTVDRDEFEASSLRAAKEEIVNVAAQLGGGISTGHVELSRSNDEATTEIRVYAYRDGQICDALELIIWTDGAPAGSVDDVRAWFRDQAPTLGA